MPVPQDMVASTWLSCSTWVMVEREDDTELYLEGIEGSEGGFRVFVTQTKK